MANVDRLIGNPPEFATKPIRKPHRLSNRVMSKNQYNHLVAQEWVPKPFSAWELIGTPELLAQSMTPRIGTNHSTFFIGDSLDRVVRTQLLRI